LQDKVLGKREKTVSAIKAEQITFLSQFFHERFMGIASAAPQQSILVPFKACVKDPTIQGGGYSRYCKQSILVPFIDTIKRV